MVSFQRVVIDTWNEQQSRAGEIAGKIEKRLKAIDAELDRLGVRIAETTSDTVYRTLAAQVERLTSERCRLEQTAANAEEPGEDAGTLFDRVRGMLKSPYQTWKEGDLSTKRIITRMVFTGPLPYIRKQGFGTPEISLPYLLLQHIATEKCDVVDPALKSWNSPHSSGHKQSEQGAWLEFIQTIREWTAELG